ncbi:MAG: GNAT family N-acetyltransferase [Beijerinckiaceae bacterium]|jgi:GNAT superfamily N-acetyltransferase|nr:GNAT family N-acetyltransferase [Beijerinckiaceae bacterium]MDO9439618.1 GNAT family N-acetyltransferase [Beijerinckiaceae bacterium]
MSVQPQVRPATPDDLAAVFSLVRELADYEQLSDEVTSSADALAAALFAEHPRVFCDVAHGPGEAVAGISVWFYSFSTFRGKHGLYIEDLFVRPKYRGKGYGRALLARAAKRCVAEGLGRLEWAVLDWNEPAIGFYQAQGAQMMDGWTTCRMSDEALWRLADKSL